MAEVDYDIKRGFRIETSIIDIDQEEVSISVIAGRIAKALVAVQKTDVPPAELIFAHEFASLYEGGDGTSVFAGMLLASLLETEDLSIKVETTPMVESDLLDLEARMAGKIEEKKDQMAQELMQLEDLFSRQIVELKERIKNGRVGLRRGTGHERHGNDDEGPEKEPSES